MKQISTSPSNTILYIKKDFCKKIIYCSRENISVEASNFEISGPNSDTLLYHLNKLSMNDILTFLNKSIDFQLRKFNRKKSILAIDFHDREYYGDENDFWVVGGKYKNGTCWFHRYATIEIISQKHRLTLFALPYHNFSNKEDVVKALIGKAMEYVNIELVMLDRGFFSSHVIKELNKMGIDFLMPAVNNRRVERINKSVHDYEMKGSKFNLIVKGKRKWATSLNFLPEKLTRMYRKRWRIETGYSKKKDFKLKTRTRNSVIRFLFFVVEVLMYNCWMLVRFLPSVVKKCCWKIKRLTTRLFKKKFLGIP